jgi:hypothetical protein
MAEDIRNVLTVEERNDLLNAIAERLGLPKYCDMLVRNEIDDTLNDFFRTFEIDAAREADPSAALLRRLNEDCAKAEAYDRLRA